MRISTNVMKFKLLFWIPVSTRLCVKNGRMSCRILAVIIPNINWIPSRLYGFKYWKK